jgi:hypothetical protein
MESLDVEIDGKFVASFNLDMYPDNSMDIIKDFCEHLKHHKKIKSWTIKHIFEG